MATDLCFGRRKVPLPPDTPRFCMDTYSSGPDGILFAYSLSEPDPIPRFGLLVHITSAIAIVPWGDAYSSPPLQVLHASRCRAPDETSYVGRPLSTCGVWIAFPPWQCRHPARVTFAPRPLITRADGASNTVPPAIKVRETMCDPSCARPRLSPITPRQSASGLSQDSCAPPETSGTIS